MLVLGAGNAEIDQLGADGVELGLSLGHVGFRADAAGKEALGQVELIFEVGDSGLEQLDIGIEAAELEVVGGHVGLEGQVDVGHVGGAGLGVFASGLDSAANATPEVGLPTGLALKEQIVVIRRCVVCGERPVGRVFVMRDGRTGRKRGKQRGTGDLDLVARGQISLQRLAQALVIGGNALFKLVELRVVVDFPPLALDHAVGGVGRGPATVRGIGRWDHDRGGARLFVGGRRGIGGTLVIRADGLATGERDEDGEAGGGE